MSPDDLALEIGDQPSIAERLRLSLGRRGIAFALALAVEIGVALLLLLLWPTLTGKPDKSVPNVFGIDAGTSDEDEADQSKPDAQKAAPKRETKRAEQPTPPKPETLPPPPPPVEANTPLPETYVKVTRRDFSTGDIANVPPGRPAASAGSPAAAESGGGARPGDSQIVGRAPNGEPLYAAEWRREPTNAELAPFISKRARFPGWGLIACRVVVGYRVEDCQELGEGPVGSGLAGSVRQAAWQFRVRPPRVGGAEKFDTWVRIRIDYSDRQQ